MSKKPIIDGDPLEDIKDLDNVTAVMKNGRLYTVAELMAPFQAPGAAAAPQNRVVAPSAETVGSARKFWWHDPEQMIEDEHKGP